MVSEQEKWGEIIFEGVFLSLFIFIFSVDIGQVRFFLKIEENISRE